jgi:hypothetical protein
VGGGAPTIQGEDLMPNRESGARASSGVPVTTAGLRFVQD